MAEGQKTVALFGATGSIGSSTLDLVLRHPERFRVSILTGGRNVKLLSQLALRFRPDHVAIADEKLLPELRDNLASEGATEGASEGASEGIEVHGGDAAIADLARIDADLTVAAITGMAGLMPVLNAVERGGVVAIANKESIVTAGALILEAAKKSGAVLLPMDSEHNAIMQAMVGQKPESID
ncbi:MAG: 1-deoxy-D-xylulose-5-phosphate reductoisomerase, partial [SAR116 cluster bacterium MED-G04]